MFEREKNEKIVYPNASQKDGSTKHYPFFDIDKQKQLRAFCAHLQTFDGSTKTVAEAHQVTKDVSKYMAFAGKQFSWQHLLDQKMQKKYILLLESDKRAFLLK